MSSPSVELISVTWTSPHERAVIRREQTLGRDSIRESAGIRATLVNLARVPNPSGQVQAWPGRRRNLGVWLVAGLIGVVDTVVGGKISGCAGGPDDMTSRDIQQKAYLQRRVDLPK